MGVGKCKRSLYERVANIVHRLVTNRNAYLSSHQARRVEHTPPIGLKLEESVM